MGRLDNGKWIYEDVIPKSSDGQFRRQQQKFRDFITVDGPYQPEKDRYHLYVSYACPWAHRTLITRKLKDLENLISVSVVSPNMLEEGWTFAQDFEGATADTVLGKSFLRDVYVEADQTFSGKVTVPVLWDKKTNKIVNNESEDVVRIFNSAFNQITGSTVDLYPEELRSEIDSVNEDVYNHINNGVYKAGFALNQSAYEKNVTQLFEALDRIETRLEGKDLVGEVLTEADIRLYTTLARFDCVYHGHFKCNIRMLRDYGNLSRYLSKLYAMPELKETTHFDHIKQHYYFSHKSLNPTQVVPLGPEVLVPDSPQSLVRFGESSDFPGERPGNSANH